MVKYFWNQKVSGNLPSVSGTSFLSAAHNEIMSLLAGKKKLSTLRDMVIIKVGKLSVTRFMFPSKRIISDLNRSIKT